MPILGFYCRSVLFFLCVSFLFTGNLQASSITVNGAGSYATIAAAFATPSPCTTGNCEIEVPAGVWTMSSTIALTVSQSNIIVKCMGMPWINNGDTRGTTTIRWTGGASAMFTFSGNEGFIMDGCDVDNTGSATNAFSLLTGNHDFHLRKVHSEPSTSFSQSFLQGVNGTNANVFVSIQDSYFNTAGGTNGTIDIDRTNNIYIKDSMCLFSRSGPSCVRFGNASAAIAITIDGLDCETYSTGGSTQACVDFENVGGAVWTGGYCELNEDGITASGQVCAKISSISDVNITGVFMTGHTSANYLISDAGSKSFIKGNYFTECATAGIDRTAFNSVSDISPIQTLDACAATMNTVGIPAASLGTPPNGIIQYCPDCIVANPCAGGGTGALAKRLNGAWVCN
jgi:hypothetical protein